MIITCEKCGRKNRIREQPKESGKYRCGICHATLLIPTEPSLMEEGSLILMSMDTILNNPFRILGLLADASEREVEKRSTDLKMFVELGKTSTSLTDFPCFPECCRTKENIEQAKRQIEQVENRIFYSFFWFSKKDTVDDLALDVLKEGRVEKALELWERAFSKQVNSDRIEPDDEEIDNAIIDNALIPYLKENYSIKNILSDRIKKQTLIDSLKAHAKEVRCNFIDDESCYLLSTEPIGEDDNGEEMELDTEITKDDYEKIVLNILQRKLALHKKDFPRAKNLAVLYLGLAFNGKEINHDYLQKALHLTGRMFHSITLLDQYYGSLVTPNYQFDWDRVSKSFIDEVLKLIKPLHDAETRTFETIAKCFAFFPSECRKYAIDKLISSPFKAIEKKISECAEKRRNTPLEANEFGNNLYKTIYGELLVLKNILSTSNLQYQNMADAAANEIISCSVDYFNAHREKGTEIDPGEDALKLATCAHSIAIDTRIKERIRKSLANLQEWVNDKPSRERQKKSEPHINYIIERLKGLPDADRASPDEMNIAGGFLTNCVSHLNHLRNILGTSSSLTPSTLILERFEDNENKWPETDDDAYVTKVDDRKYIFRNKGKVEARWGWSLTHLDFTKYDEFTAECSISKLSGKDNYGFGIVWAYKKTNDDISYHSYYISGDGHYIIMEHHSTATTEWNWKESEHILKYNDSNILTIKKRNNGLTYFINNKPLEERHLENISGWGIGFLTNENISIAINYLYFCDAYVSNFKDIIDHDFYLNLGSAVAARALDLCIAYANRTSDWKKPFELMKTIRGIDMKKELRERFNKNEKVLEDNIMAELRASIAKPTAIPDSAQKGTTFCYIATMVYESHDAPEVRTLRKFRDELLSRYRLGRALVKAYYAVSPFIVRILKNNWTVHRLLKFMLDGLVGWLR